MTAVLTALIVAFLASSSRNTAVTAGDSAKLRAEQLAQTALHELVRNLQNEMFAGSLDPQGTHSQPDVPIDTENGSGAGSLLFPAKAQSSVPCVTQLGAPINLSSGVGVIHLSMLIEMGELILLQICFPQLFLLRHHPRWTQG